VELPSGDHVFTGLVMTTLYFHKESDVKLKLLSKQGKQTPSDVRRGMGGGRRTPKHLSSCISEKLQGILRMCQSKSSANAVVC